MKSKLNNLRLFCFSLLAGFAIMQATGCTMCCPPYLDDYATVGGKWARTNPTDGRVGSAFSDPNISTVSGTVVAFPENIDAVPEYSGEFETVPMGTEAQEDGVIILGEGW